MWIIPDLHSVIRYPSDIQLRNTHYPRSIFTQWTPDELAAVGIYSLTPLTIPPFYVAGPAAYEQESPTAFREVTEVIPEMSVEELKSEVTRRAKEDCNHLLTPTDWYVTRAADPADGRPVPADVVERRMAIKSACSDFETAVAPLTDYDAVVTAWRAHRNE